jgi:hypothetical protein
VDYLIQRPITALEPFFPLPPPGGPPLSSEHRLGLDWRSSTDPVTTSAPPPNCINQAALTLRVVTEPCQQSGLPTQTGAA